MRMKLNGQIVSDEDAEMLLFYGYEHGYVCPADLREAVDGLKEGEELVLEINSVGGDIWAASEMYSIVKGYSGPTRAIIQSVAASAASYLSMACDLVEMALPAQMMLHQAWKNAVGNQDELRKSADDLAVTDESMLAVYADKCGGKVDRETLRGMIRRETWIGAEQCVELGLADSILGRAESANAAAGVLDLRTAASLEAPAAAVRPVPWTGTLVGNLFQALCALPDIGPLRERYQAARQEGERKAAETDAWREQAEAELEAERQRWSGAALA